MKRDGSWRRNPSLARAEIQPLIGLEERLLTDASTKLGGNRYQALLEWDPLGSNEFRPAGPSVGFLTGDLAGDFDGGVMTLDGAPPALRLRRAGFIEC